MKKSLFLLLILVSTVVFAQDDPVIAVPQIGIKVALGETITIGDLHLKFEEVLEDSRCPKGVTCVWAGRARVRIEVSDDGMTVDHQELVFGEDAENLIMKIGEFQVSGMALSPYPTAEDSGERNYVLLLSKTDLD